MYIRGFRTRQHLGPLVPVMNDDDDNDSQMIFGDLGGLKLPNIFLIGEENPKKTSPRKLVPTGDRTQARCMTGAHDICLTGEEKPRKNLTQETCPDRGSNPGPLRDRHMLPPGPQWWTKLSSKVRNFEKWLDLY